MNTINNTTTSVLPEALLALAHRRSSSTTPSRDFSYHQRPPTRREQYKRAYSITLEQVAQLFDRPAKIAAIELGICSTAFKKMCRRHGIQRWPYRRYRSLQSTIQALERLVPMSHEEEQQRLQEEIREMKDRLNRMVKNPSETIAMDKKESSSSPSSSPPTSPMTSGEDSTPPSKQASSSPCETDETANQLLRLNGNTMRTKTILKQSKATGKDDNNTSVVSSSSNTDNNSTQYGHQLTSLPPLRSVLRPIQYRPLQNTNVANLNKSTAMYQQALCNQQKLQMIVNRAVQQVASKTCQREKVANNNNSMSMSSILC